MGPKESGKELSNIELPHNTAREERKKKSAAMKREKKETEKSAAFKKVFFPSEDHLSASQLRRKHPKLFL